MAQIFVRCRSRTELSIDEFRRWLQRRSDAARPIGVRVVEAEELDGTTWLLEVEVGDESIDPRDHDVGELVVDLRLLGLSPAVFLPDR